MRSPVWERAEPAQRERFAADLDRLRSAGAVVTERDLPPAFDDALRIHRTIMLREAATAARAVRKKHRHVLSEFLNRGLDEGEAVTPAGYAEALAARLALIDAIVAFFGDEYEAIVTPPAAGEAPLIDTTGDPAFCTLWSLLGVPAAVIPTGLGPRGLPLGLQIVARPEASNTLLAVAAWCEAQLPFEGLLARGLMPRVTNRRVTSTRGATSGAARRADQDDFGACVSTAVAMISAAGSAVSRRPATTPARSAAGRF